MHSLFNPGTLSKGLKRDAPGDTTVLLLCGCSWSLAGGACASRTLTASKNSTQAEPGGKAEQGEGGNSALWFQQWSNKVKQSKPRLDGKLSQQPLEGIGKPQKSYFSLENSIKGAVYPG